MWYDGFLGMLKLLLGELLFTSCLVYISILVKGLPKPMGSTESESKLYLSH